jgi:protein AFG1
LFLGGVGCGKTFLMNLLYDAIDSGPWVKDKQKVHFHKFMLQVHQHMHQQRKIQKDPNGDLITPVVDEILKQGRLLCLDEFQVTDVADAMILKLLFEGLWKKGCILVATSNRPPSDLYLHGLQRDRFLPFIDRLQQQCNVVDLLDSETDYRMLANATSSADGSSGGKNGDEQQQQKPLVYFTKGDSASSKQFRNLFYKLAENHPTNPTALSTQGRTVPIPLACTQKRIAYFAFSDVCQKAMGAADYLVIANNFSTVFCHHIPKLTVNELNWLRRFIIFVDTMYELKVTLVLHTAQPVDSVRDLFSVEGDKESYSQDEVFAFDRTLSRLEEMSSPKYLKSQWLGGSKKKRLEKQQESPLKASTNWLLNKTKSQESQEEDDEHNKVTTKLSLQPSLSSHHLESGGPPRTY